MWQKDVEAALSEWLNKGIPSFSFDQFGKRKSPDRSPD